MLEGGSFRHIAVREDGSVIAAGLSSYQGVFGDLAVFENHWLGAFGADGGLLWSQEIPFPVNEFGEYEERQLTSVSVASDGAVFIAILDYGDFDVSDNQVSKFAADGSALWTTILPSRPATVAATGDGGALVGGTALIDEATRVLGWAVRLDSLGAIVASRTWDNDDGRNSGFEASVASDVGLVLGGRAGTSAESSQAEAWFVWVDDDLQTERELRLPGSGGTDGVRSLRIGEDGNIIAGVDIDATAIVTLSPTGDVLSTEVTSPDYVQWSPYSPTAYLGGERSNCGDEIGFGSCGTAIFYGFESGAAQWETTFDCGASTGYALDAIESLVSVGCRGEGDALTAEIHRIVVD